MWWLVVLLVLFAMLLTAVNVLPGPAWAEMPTDRTLLTVDRGRVTAVVDGTAVLLTPGDRRYLTEGARVETAERSVGRLTFRGGAVTLLCGGSRTAVGALSTGSGGRAARASLTLDNGRLLTDSSSTSGAFQPLSLTVRRPAGDVVNAGPAWYAVEAGTVTVSAGTVQVAGAPAVADESDLTCGDGVPVAPPAGAPSETPTSAPPVVSGPPSLSPSVTGSTSVAPTPATTTGTTPTPTAPTAGPGPTTTAPPTRPTTRPTSRPPGTRPTRSSPTPTSPSSPPESPRPSPPPPSTPPVESQSAPPVPSGSVSISDRLTRFLEGVTEAVR
jgi:putative peptide zinc metalloprotease protein